MLGVYFAAGIAGPLVAPYDLSRPHVELLHQFEGSSAQHWLGTDDVGSDVLCRLIHGSRISLSVGFVAVGISGVIASSS